MTLSSLLVAAHLPPIAPALAWGMGGVLILLLLGTFAALVLPALRPKDDHTNLRQRMLSWWVMAALIGAALLLGWGAIMLLFAVASFIALRELLSLAPLRREDRLVVLLAYLVIPANYALLAFNLYGIYLVFIPVWAFLVAPLILAMIGQTRAYLSTAATFHWGLMTCVYTLGFGAYLAMAPHAKAPEAGGVGLVFFLLFATEANDVAQYVCGRLLGRHKIVPKVSPNKTWEGFVGGWITTSLAIWFLGPFFLPLRGYALAILAAVLPVAGFAGDVTMSAIKRDIGVKDTSRLIPGHGGVLDRVDSLTFTAPVYFHLITFFAFGRLPWS